MITGPTYPPKAYFITDDPSTPTAQGPFDVERCGPSKVYYRKDGKPVYLTRKRLLAALRVKRHSARRKTKPARKAPSRAWSGARLPGKKSQVMHILTLVSGQVIAVTSSGQLFPIKGISANHIPIPVS